MNINFSSGGGWGTRCLMISNAACHVSQEKILLRLGDLMKRRNWEGFCFDFILIPCYLRRSVLFRHACIMLLAPNGANADDSKNPTIVSE